MKNKSIKIFFAALFFSLSFAFSTAKANFVPGTLSLHYLSIGWVLEPTELDGGRWFVHAYDPDSPTLNWDDYEE